MSKGYPRGLARGKAQKQAITKLQLLVDHTVNIAAAGADIGFGTVVLGGLPEGHLKIMTSAINLRLSGPTSADLSDTWNGDFGVGSTPLTDATISGTDEDLIVETALGAATAEVSPVHVVANGVDHVLDNTDGSLEINLNVLVDAADIVDATDVDLLAEGYIEITLITMLDD